MWRAKYTTETQTTKEDVNNLISGKISAIIWKNFFKKNQCEQISTRILNLEEKFDDEKLKHLGPFLMEYTTRKEQYFKMAETSKQSFKKIFPSHNYPTEKIFKHFKKIFPEYSFSLAKETNQEFSPFVIRIHENGKSIPIHKDNVKYEGIEFDVSKIDVQLSCVVHLQESEEGGKLITYNKKWKKEHEKLREIDFGYTNNIISKIESCEISNIQQGDLVIINPNYYHQVTKITGITPRITLGMFLGFFKEKNQIVSWA